MLKASGIKKECSVTIRYERLPEFCFRCGIIGHMAKDCPDKRRKNEISNEKLESGSWLKFQGFYRHEKKPESPSRNQNNNEGPESSKETDLNNDKEIMDNMMGKVNEGNQSLVKLGGKETNINIGERVEYNLNEKAPENEGVSMHTKSGHEGNNEQETSNMSGTGSEGSQTGFEVSARKRLNWKRSARITRAKRAMKESNGVHKRKREMEEDGGNKKTKGKESNAMNLNSDEEMLAVAGEQPC